MVSRQIVLVLASNGRDIYVVMARMAVASVRLSDPEAHVLVVCDAETHAAALAAGADWLNEVDEVVPCATPAGNAAYRSRYVKTRMRELVKGSFLFLDLDVLVRGRLDGAFPPSADIAAAVNHGRSTLEGQIVGKNEDVIRAMGWRRSDAHYLNTGVIYFNDTPAAHQFGQEWHRRWLLQWDHTGSHHDQPAFNAALHDLAPVFSVLPLSYNAQIRSSPALAPGAHVWHYYISVEVDTRTAYGCELDRLMRGGKFERRRISRLIKAPHPWRRTHPLDDLVAARVVRQGRMELLEQLWFKGQRWEAFRRYYKQIGRYELRRRVRAMVPDPLVKAVHKCRSLFGASGR